MGLSEPDSYPSGTLSGRGFFAAEGDIMGLIRSWQGVLNIAKEEKHTALGYDWAGEDRRAAVRGVLG